MHEPPGEVVGAVSQVVWGPAGEMSIIPQEDSCTQLVDTECRGRTSFTQGV